MKTLSCLSFLLLAILCSCDKNASLITETVINSEIATGDKPISVNITPDANAKQLVDDNTIYEFINNCIVSDVSYFKHCNTIIGREYIPPFIDERDSLQIIRADSIFTKADADFIFKQARCSTTFKVDENKLTEKRRVINPEFCEVYGEDREDYWDNIHARFGAFCSIKMPLFSIDHKTAIVGLSYSCGMLCGSGALYIYRKINGKWTRIAVWDEWVS